MKIDIHSLFIAVALLILQGCAGTRVNPGVEDLRYSHADDGTLAGRYAPIIAPQRTSQEYNRVGYAAARLDRNKQEEIYINTSGAVFYTDEQSFVAGSGRRYHNLIYRFHFSRVPQLHLTAGDNVGLFVVITLDEQQRPVLIITVHSCGCYLAMVPTSYLPATAYPADWDASTQSVYGETLPGRLDYPTEFSSELRPVIRLRDATHRVMDIQLGRPEPDDTQVDLLPVASLDNLSLGDGHTSFFYESGRLKGYVKGAFKPWELLLMSWWILDLNVGRDKKLGDPAETGTVFYTSLKPWAREASNMWFFADFLAYWGWRL
jgi:hypothetical protein